MIVWLQPLLCMTTFLSIVNWGFHAFIHYDENGEQVGRAAALPHRPCAHSHLLPRTSAAPLSLSS